MGEEGYLADKGLVPLPEDEIVEVRAAGHAADAAVDVASGRERPGPGPGRSPLQLSRPPCCRPSSPSSCSIAIAAYFLASRRAMAISGGRSAELHSRPGYYASYAALMAVGPAIALWAVWRLFEPRSCARWCCAPLRPT